MRDAAMSNKQLESTDLVETLHASWLSWCGYVTNLHYMLQLFEFFQNYSFAFLPDPAH